MKRLALALTMALTATTAQAVTAGDFLDRMDQAERAAFMNGALDMIAYQLATTGQGERASCLVQWYYEGQGPEEIAAVFPNHRDLPAVGIVVTLIERHCP